MILRRIKLFWISDQPTFNSVMLWAATVVTFFSFCRSGEADTTKFDPSADLSLADVAVDNPASPAIISLMIKQSKTDQERVGVKVFIRKARDDLCSVNTLMNYLQRRGNAPGTLFQWQDYTLLSQMAFVSATRQALASANLPAHDFAGHSFHIGAATTAAMAGIEDSTIQTLSKQKSSSYKLYIRMDPHQ